MISVKCKTTDKILLNQITPFQGTLKKRTADDIAGLKQSLLTEGLLMPFVIWKHDDCNFLLDGHGRLLALTELAEKQNDILYTMFPCIFVTAETEDDARKALLQITSQYGKITKQGVKQFTVSIPDYVAPSIKKFVAPSIKKASIGMVKNTLPQSDYEVLKLKVPKDKVESLKEIFKSFDYIKVL